MITQNLLEKIRDLEFKFIEDISLWRIQSSIINRVEGLRFDDDLAIDIDNQEGLEKLWEYVYPAFHEQYVLFLEQIRNLLDISDSNWDGEVVFYTNLWNRYQYDLFHNWGYDISIGSSEEGGSYFMAIYGYRSHEISFTKNADGKVVIEKVDWDTFRSD